MSKGKVLIALGVVAFLAISFQLARFLTAENAERAAIFRLLEDEGRGDVAAVAGALGDCADPACSAALQRTVARAKRPGKVKILRLDSGGSFTLSDQTALSRVAWAADATAGGVAVVQCVTVRRSWSFVSGASVSLRRLSAPLPPEKSC